MPAFNRFGRGGALLSLALAILATVVGAQAQTAAPLAGPPPDPTALVEAPKDPVTVPPVSKPLDGTTASVSAGGQLATGNSRILALTVNGQYDSRWGANGLGASLLGNYGQGAPPGAPIVETADHVQGRLRYD